MAADRTGRNTGDMKTTLQRRRMVQNEMDANDLQLEMVSEIHRVRDELIGSKQTERALKVGDKAPRFRLPDHRGIMVSSEDLLGLGAVVLTFYRGAWCPYCAFDVESLGAVRPAFESRGAVIAAVSQQPSAAGSQCRTVDDPDFPLLTDKDGLLAARFGIRWTVPTNLQRIYKLLDDDPKVINSEASWMLSMPARYVIDRDGYIVYAELSSDYTVRSEPFFLFPILDRLARRVTQ